MGDFTFAIKCTDMQAPLQPGDSAWAQNMCYPPQLLQQAKLQQLGQPLNYANADAYAAGVVIKALLDSYPSVKAYSRKTMLVAEQLTHPDIH